MLCSPLPDINLSCLERSFSLDLPSLEITSLDISSTGSFIIAGCSNGMVVLFDMTSSDRLILFSNSLSLLYSLTFLHFPMNS